MLQVAFGGYTLVEGDITQFTDDPTYYEPGFNLMSPLELSIPKSDTFYILIRKRDGDSGNTFEHTTYTNFSVTVKDATNGEPLSAQLSDNGVNTPWDFDPSGIAPVTLMVESQLNLLTPVLRIRVIDVEVKDTTDDSFINFRIIVEDDPTDLHFNYIPVSRTTYTNRNTFTAASRIVYMTLRNDSDAYILVSPYAWLTESTEELSDFSYPQDSSYYKRETTFNNEDFTFALQSWSNDFVEEDISVMNIPGYRKVCLILIDNDIYNNMKAIQKGINFTVSLTGELSGIEDTFIVNLRT